MRPTREGRHSPMRAGLVYYGIGIDPDVVTTDPPATPPDRAGATAGGQAFVPFLNPGVAAVVQYKSSGVTNPGNVTITLDDAPLPGNLLVLCVAQDADSGPTFTIDNGTWTQVNSDVYSGNGTNWPNRMYYQPVTGATSASTTVNRQLSSTGSLKVALIELSGVDTLDSTASASNTATTTATLTPTASEIAIIVSATFARNASVTALSPATGMTEWAEVGPADRPLAANYRVISSTSGGYTVGSTGADANSSMIAGAFIDTGISLNWVPAHLTIDGSDSTWDPAFEDSVVGANGIFWRGTLDDTYLIGSAEIRAGFETAGANTITIQGATEADYSDATTVDTIAFTATGSFTAQDLSASWVPTAVYRYWQLILTTDDAVHIHDVQLLDFDDSGGVTDHGALTGLGDDDHPQYLREVEADALYAPLVDVPVDLGSVGATETIDVSSGRWQQITLNANCTITVTGYTVDEGVVALIKVTQDGTGGWDLTWDTDVVFAGDDQPGQTAGDVTWFLLWSDEGDGTIYGAKVGSGGSSLTVENEGSALATAATTLDFVGAGVTASGTGAEKTITIPGVTEADVETAGRWELAVIPGSPPDPLYADGDYLYIWVPGA